MYMRYAIYYTPDLASPLAQFGASWLGWDIHQGVEMPHPDMPDLPDAIADLTQTPRKYGFHGTLKAPFHLTEGKTETGLCTAIERFAQSRHVFEFGPLHVTNLGRFIALTQITPNPSLHVLASACVRELDVFRAPMTVEDLQRRRKSNLTARQDALLRFWGYPYVMEEFRFHLTLTGPIAEDKIDAVKAILTKALSPLLNKPFTFTHLTLCGQSDDGYFHAIKRFPLGC